MEPVITETWVHFLQAGLMIFGIYFAVEVLRFRMRDLYQANSEIPGLRLFPMLVFVSGVVVFNMWLLMEPMVMRF